MVRERIAFLAHSFCIFIVVIWGCTNAYGGPESGRSMVASDHGLASEAGLKVLRAGGNGVDAAVATALAAGVVQPSGSGLGGGGFAMVVCGSKPPVVVDFREVAPESATRDMFRNPDGTVDPDRSRYTGLAVGVPGESRGLASLLSGWGTMSHWDVSRPARRLAKGGFYIEPHLAQDISETSLLDVQAYFSDRTVVRKKGEWLRRPVLARTLDGWAKTEGDYLYSGVGADEILAHVRAGGGEMSLSDLANYTPKKREPIVFQYGALEVLTMPPPSSGGVAIAQMLQSLQHYDMGTLVHNSPEYIHLVTEVMKHAFADRAHFLGDPDFVDVPVPTLIHSDRVSEIVGAFNGQTTLPMESYGPLITPPSDGGTQHISVLDERGCAVALTTTINTVFGSGQVVDSLGIILNNEMDDFSAAPGVPNHFGLVGGESNSIVAGKRPLSSMSPTVIRDENGRVLMVVGASGGSRIISSVLQVILNVLEFGMNADEAVSAPRFHHQWAPNILFLDPAISETTKGALEAKGHEVVVKKLAASVQVVLATETGTEGASDPRKGGRPAGLH